MTPFRSSGLIAAQQKVVRLWHEREKKIRSWEDAFRVIPIRGADFDALAAEIQLINTYQWHEEDKSRATDVSDAELAQVKRNIDQSNQRRVHAVERFDGGLEARSSMKSRAALNSETPGSIVDRISILNLKLYHMSQQRGANAQQRAKFAGKLSVLKVQLKDLAGCLDALMKEIEKGKRRFKTYYQLKMYNDPETNPYIKTKR